MTRPDLIENLMIYGIKPVTERGRVDVVLSIYPPYVIGKDDSLTPSLWPGLCAYRGLGLLGKRIPKWSNHGAKQRALQSSREYLAYEVL